MSDFRLNVIAETQKAERSLKAVGRVADEATKSRKLNIDTAAVSKNFANLGKDIKSASNNIQQFYTVTKKLPIVGDSISFAEKKTKELATATGNLAASTPKAAVGLVKSADAGTILSRSLNAAASATNGLITSLAKIGFAIYAIKESTSILKTAFGGLFNETVGRAAQFQETLLKTQTTLASTSKVLVDGVEITDPLKKILALQGEIEKRVDSIRIKSIDLAGVTSNDVVEVFGIVASQISQINGNLEDAENLAIQFSAALGTFGLPLFQARQEIGSIFRGDIGPDSYLANALGIRPDDIRRAKGEIGGVVGFLEERLAASVAGQEIAAKGLAGVLSNIRDIAELIGQAIGEPILDPIVKASAAIYDILFQSKDLLQGLGDAIGNVFSRAAERVAIAFEFDTPGEIPVLAAIKAQAPAVVRALKQDVEGFTRTLDETLTRLGSAFRTLFGSLAALSGSTVKAFRELLEAFIELQLVSFESLISALATLAQGITPILVGLTELLKAWASILQLPIVQYFTQIAVTFAVLKATGVIAIAAITTQLLIWSVSFDKIIAKARALGVVVAGAIKSISVSLGSLLLLLAQASGALKGLLIAQGADPKAINELSKLEVELNKVGRNAKGVAYNFRNLGASIATVGRSIGSFLLNLIKANALIIGVTVGITLLVDIYGRVKRAQEELKQSQRDDAVIKNYIEKIRGLNRELTAAEKKAKAAALAAADKNYDAAQAKVEELTLKIEKLNKIASGTGGGTSGLSGRKYAANEAKKLQAELDKQKAIAAKNLAVLEKEEQKKNVEIQNQNRVNLEREIGDLKRQIDSDLFQQRQALAQKEVDIFRAAGELRIKQIERANAKLIEGEEGASRTALEALNNYIAIRERGELDIEAAKKSLAIEVANLDKAASDYRLDIERKIADLRKKSADYEKNAADQRDAGAGGPAGSLIELIGATESFGGNYGAFNRGGRDGGRTAIGSGIDENLTNTQISEILRRQTARNVPANQQLFAVGKYQITPDTLKGLLAGKYGETGVKASDKFTPAVQDKLGAALARSRVVPGDIDATIKGLRQEWIGLQNVSDEKLRAAVQPLVGGGAAAAATTSEIPDSAAAADAYDAAIKGVAGSLEEYRSVQEAITRADTAEAFENIAKALFPQVALEQYQDRLVELGYTYDAIASGANEVFDPQRSAIEVERLAKIAVSNRELAQTQKGIAEQTKLSEAERQRAISDLVARQAQYVEQLNREAQLKASILTTEQATNFIRQASQAAQDIQGEIEALQLRNRLQAEGVAPELIQAELAKLQIRREVDLLTKSLNTQLTTEIALRDQLQQRIAAASGPEKEELQRKLNEALTTIENLRKQLKGVREAGGQAASAQDRLAAAQTAPGTRINAFIGEAERQLKDYEALAIRVSQSVGDAVGNSLSNGISGLIEGTTTAKEIFSNFLKDIGRILLQEGTKIIATYVAIGIAKIFAGFIGGGDGASTAANFELPDPAFIPKGGFGFPGAANGAYFANGRASFAQSSLQPFANGGVVNQPTLFQFAKGGATGGGGSIPFQMGVMGEAGPEAIMPLSRGSDGRLGVTANIPFTKSQDRLATERADRETAAAINDPKPIDVRFESQVINNVEYVTAEEYRKGMNQAAERGRTLTLAALQNSVKTRKRVGIG